ncbi:hypothetical protein [Sinosporangium siamense]|uniref:hypothetical protein n=1 Tax=Sinosporangium siamense TaxID=1367973 RepID=UPI00195194EA|nr:hypothetical protein [Sinosporangium siamense]
MTGFRIAKEAGARTTGGAFGAGMARTAGRLAGALLGAALLSGGTPAAAEAAQTPPAALACAHGLFRDGNVAQYRNCTNVGERLFVTYLLPGMNEYVCVPAHETRYLGRWAIVFRVYNRGNC